jgi:hypothetical protein
MSLTPEQAIMAGQIGAAILKLQASIESLSGAIGADPVISGMTASVQVGGRWVSLALDCVLSTGASASIITGVVGALKDELAGLESQLSALG